MKKIYISPETIVVELMPVVGLMELSTHEETPDPDAGQFTKEYVSDDDASTGRKNVWDEEW